jgi:probable F420-dependent oxidoreductase
MPDVAKTGNTLTAMAIVGRISRPYARSAVTSRQIDTETVAVPTVSEDLSAFLIAGRVVSQTPRDAQTETEARTPRQGIEDGVDAERLGFRRVFISERFNLKEAAVILGAVGGRTSRIGLATGLVSPGRRHLSHMAALGATMHACFGPRLVLGLGRGIPSFVESEGLRSFSYDALRDYVQLLRRLWRGETIDYHGPAGRYEGLRLGDIYEGPAPEVWYGMYGGPQAAEVAASVFDGVLLPPPFTPQATRQAVQRLRTACERADRDPASLRVCQCVITAPELSDAETRALAHARAVTYLEVPVAAESVVRANGWDMSIVEALRRHRQFAGQSGTADSEYHRVQLMEPARRIPDEWMQESCALGSLEQCVSQLARFRAAGADEIATYGSTPAQNARLLAAWEARKGVESPERQEDVSGGQQG